MKNQHTPGPWAVSPYNNIVSKNGTVAKTEQMPGNDDEERKANAHLIAAAPDLLSALQEMMSVFQDHEQYDEESAEVVSIARAAIAKAGGVK